MSCAQVMYQAYTPYFAYPAQRSVAHAVPSATSSATQQDMATALPYETKKFGVGKIHEPLEASNGNNSTDFCASTANTSTTTATSTRAPCTSSPNLPTRNNTNNCSTRINTSSSSPANNNNNNNSNNNVGSTSSSSSSSSTSSSAASASASAAAARSAIATSVLVQTSAHIKGSDVIKSEANVAPEAQYISANCVLFTYYSGDISSVVDEHFSRALSQQSAYEASKGLLTKGFYQHCDGECCGYGVKSGRHLAPSRQDVSPMAQRNFPPSFWNSNYHHHHHHHHHHHSSSSAASSLVSHNMAMAHGPHDLAAYSTDPYHAGALHHHAIPQADPWHYPLTSQSNPYTHAHAHSHSHAHRGSVHELAYSPMPSTSRFNAAQYSPLLLQPPSVGRSARLANAVAAAGQCAAAAAAALGKAPAEPWAPPRYHDALSVSAPDMAHLDAAANYAPPHAYSAMSAMPGLEGPVQDSAKDLYWF